MSLEAAGLDVRCTANPVGWVTLDLRLDLRASAPAELPPKIVLPVPGYFYRHPTFLGICLPVASIGTLLHPQLLRSECADGQTTADVSAFTRIRRTAGGHCEVVVDLSDPPLPLRDRPHRALRVVIALPDYVERDRVFFSYSLPVVPPVGVVLNSVRVRSSSHFSIGIRSFRVWSRWYSQSTGKRGARERGVRTRRDGDVVSLEWSGTALPPGMELDIVVEASRIPGLPIPRRAFWTACYLLVAAAALYQLLK